MKVLIFTLGSRGDVQPYLALAVGLQRAGHRVTLATSPEFTALIESYGVATHPVRFSVQAAMQAPETRAALRSGNIVRQYRLTQRVMDKSAEAIDDFWEAAQSADLVLQTGTGNLTPYHCNSRPSAQPATRGRPGQVKVPISSLRHIAVLAATCLHCVKQFVMKTISMRLEQFTWQKHSSRRALL